jgi:hypothetical protein
LKQQWCTPSATAEFVWRMEDVLDVYCRPYDPRRPLLCMDEMGKNLVKDKHPPEDMKPGQPRREDYTYEKKGAGNVFIACEPLAGKRYLKVSKRRTKKDWAYFLKELLDLALYASGEGRARHGQSQHPFPCLRSQRSSHLKRPKPWLTSWRSITRGIHASWLNIAEIELSVLVRQGLARNIATMQEFCEQAEQWQAMRNQSGATVRWQFTTADARIKLERLYPLYKKPSGTAP